MKLILNNPVTDRVDGKPVQYQAGQAVDFPEEIGQNLLDNGFGKDFPSTKEEKVLFDNPIKHPTPKPEVPTKK